ncbi:thiamine pyrophosphate-requiring protein [Nannocystis sp. SCPEA4]|uniref:thiamine pyrophosphate-requiring protein n=1 Tax=Nannocystis sp. SCPEA4 TaxID=2996787 RepID=UPI00226DB0A5|nr:thiamine pyrophosphate-requiring protein [Nannocystis sp. SCPEA4]MCY1059044.1 thiamine pyrophosphate-requiring protein [Nannocystis sp. SCPEA4]
MANVSEFILERLSQWGVTRIFGYPGDGISGIIGALDRAPSGISFVQTRHEELAAFMACAHAKFTGEVGVCLATSGPGAIHLLNGLYDAKLDHQPVVAIVGQTARRAMGGDYQQEVDLPALFKDVAHHYIHTCVHPAQTRHLIDRAVRIARARRSVTCLVFPKDVQELSAPGEEAHEHNTVHSSVNYCTPRVVPSEADLRSAAAMLNEGRRVAILVGQGALGATDEVIAVADRLGAGVAKALLGIAAVPDDVPYVTGAIGLLGTRPSWDMMQECDTLLMIGSSFPYSEFLPKPGRARAIQIDIDPTMLGIRYPMDLNLVGDSAETLRALLPLLEHKQDRSWQQGLIEGVETWQALLDERARVVAEPINPELVFRRLSPRLPERCIVTADSGTSANWFARDLKFRRGMMASLSGNLATMGPATPYAIAAKFAYPDRPVIACVGDGAMQMNGLNGLITISKYWREWQDPRLVIIVLNNHDLSQVTWEQRAMSGDPKFVGSQSLPDAQYGRYAELLGLRSRLVTAPEQIDDALDAALSADAPCVLDIRTDSNVPTLPPHITVAQAWAYTRAILGGDPDTGSIIRRAFGSMFPELAGKIDVDEEKKRP